MSTSETDVLRTVAATVLRRRAVTSSQAIRVSGIARSAFDDLSGVLLPLIGQAGLVALSSRALQIAQLQQAGSALAVNTSSATLNAPLASVHLWLQHQDEARLTEGAAAMFSALGALLVTFIGEALTMRLLQKAWPDGFHDPTEEARLERQG